jgi:hypothetical protein
MSRLRAGCSAPTGATPDPPHAKLKSGRICCSAPTGATPDQPWLEAKESSARSQTGLKARFMAVVRRPSSGRRSGGICAKSWIGPSALPTPPLAVPGPPGQAGINSGLWPGYRRNAAHANRLRGEGVDHGLGRLDMRRSMTPGPGKNWGKSWFVRLAIPPDFH